MKPLGVGLIAVVAASLSALALQARRDFETRMAGAEFRYYAQEAYQDLERLACFPSSVSREVVGPEMEAFEAFERASGALSASHLAVAKADQALAGEGRGCRNYARIDPRRSSLEWHRDRLATHRARLVELRNRLGALNGLDGLAEPQAAQFRRDAFDLVGSLYAPCQADDGWDAVQAKGEVAWFRLFLDAPYAAHFDIGQADATYVMPNMEAECAEPLDPTPQRLATARSLIAQIRRRHLME